MTAVVDISTPTGIGSASALDTMATPPMISGATAATAIVGLHGDKSGAASGREHDCGEKKTHIFGALGLRPLRHGMSP
jgi:hypothetical protein